MGGFGFGQSVQKLSENEEKVLFYETYFEERINRKLLNWSHDKIVMNFGPKKYASLVLGKVYKNFPKMKKKCYFTKPTSKRVISTETSYLVPL